MGYDKAEMTGHSYRAMARMIFDEVLQVRPELSLYPRISHSILS